MNLFTSVSDRPWVLRLIDLALLLVFLYLFDRSLFFLLRGIEAHVAFVPPLEEKFSSLSRPANYPILILGTSRTYEAIHPSYVRKVFGLKAYKEAFVGKGPAYNYFFYQQYRRSIGVPRIVLYGVDYFIFKEFSRGQLLKIFPEASGGDPSYNRGWSLLLANKEHLDEFISDSLNHLNERMFGNRMSVFDQWPAEMDTYIGRPARKKLAVTPNTPFQQAHYDRYPGLEGEYFENMLEMFSQDQVQVFLVVIPDFIGTYVTNYQQDRFMKDLKRLTKKYDNVQILNYNDPDRFKLAEPKFFLNGGYGHSNSHLSREGARVFNQILLGDLKRILKTPIQEPRH